MGVCILYKVVEVYSIVCMRMPLHIFTYMYIHVCMCRYELLSNCWNERGEQRPNFTTLVSKLQQLQAQHTHSHVDSSHIQPTLRVPDGRPYSTSSFGKGRSASRERLSHSGDPSLTRNHISHREASQTSLRRVSMGSILSRGSAADRLSVTFSVLSDIDGPLGSSSEDVAGFENGEGLQLSSGQQEINNILRQVSTSFIDVPIVDTMPPVLTHSMDDDTRSSVNATILSDDSSNTLVPPSYSNPVRSPKVSVTADETTSLSSSNVTPPPSQATDTYSKTSTTDLESVSTIMSAPFTSSPLQNTAFLYPASGSSGCGGGASSAEDVKRGDHSPLLVGHKARSNGTRHSLAISPSQPSAKSTDSGIRSDEDTDLTHSPNPYTSGAADAGTSTGGNSGGSLGLSDLSSSLMAAFDSWDTTQL